MDEWKKKIQSMSFLWPNNISSGDLMHNTVTMVNNILYTRVANRIDLKCCHQNMQKGH